MFDLLKNPQILALIGGSAACGGLLGWLGKAALAAFRGVSKNELEMALEFVEKAKKTPDPKDDLEAQKRLNTVRRIKAAIDSLPDFETK